MTKQEAIKHIKAIYPPDETCTGEELLIRIILDEVGWENLPEEILVRLAELQVGGQM